MTLLFIDLIPGEIYKGVGALPLPITWIFQYTPDDFKLKEGDCIRHHFGLAIEKGKKIPRKEALWNFTNTRFWTFYKATEQEKSLLTIIKSTYYEIY